MVRGVDPAVEIIRVLGWPVHLPHGIGIAAATDVPVSCGESAVLPQLIGRAIVWVVHVPVLGFLPLREDRDDGYPVILGHILEIGVVHDFVVPRERNMDEGDDHALGKEEDEQHDQEFLLDRGVDDPVPDPWFGVAVWQGTT
jgi:hypothetical protein